MYRRETIIYIYIVCCDWLSECTKEFYFTTATPDFMNSRNVGVQIMHTAIHLSISDNRVTMTGEFFGGGGSL